MSSLGVVIPNFNGRRILPDCLAALERQSPAIDAIVVVDNGSSDGSAELVRTTWPHVRVVELARNLGFGAAANAGVRSLSTDLVVVLNSDAVVRPGWTEALLGAPLPSDVWALGSVQLRPGGSRIESAGDQFLARGEAVKLLRDEPVATLPTEPYEVFAPPGAAPTFRRDVFLELGGYDERFFLYYEDLDLAFRAGHRGWRALVVPTARVEHLLGASGRPEQAAYHVGRNSLTCAVRHLPVVSVRGLARTTLLQLRWARGLDATWPYLRGRARGLLRLPVTWWERRRARRDWVDGADLLAPHPLLAGDGPASRSATR